MRLFGKRNKPRVCEAVPFIYDFARKTKRVESYKKTMRDTAAKLREFEESRGITLHSNSLTYEMVEDLNEFLKDKNFLLNTISKTLQRIFFLFDRMGKSGYEVDQSYHDFKLELEPITTVYITSEEVVKLYCLKLKERNMEIIRDLFTIGCLTGMRWSDFSTLSNSNIRGNIIIKKTKKTGAPVEIPIHRIVKEIVNKYEGFPSYRDTAQNFNKVIKTICKKAGLTDKVYIERTRGGKIERLSVPRYKMVSSHTARRSFATNAYLAGIPVARIMLITGHKTEEAFFRYIRIGRSENAKTLADHPFFN